MTFEILMGGCGEVYNLNNYFRAWVVDPSSEVTPSSTKSVTPMLETTSMFETLTHWGEFSMSSSLRLNRALSCHLTTVCSFQASQDHIECDLVNSPMQADGLLQDVLEKNPRKDVGKEKSKRKKKLSSKKRKKSSSKVHKVLS